MEGDDSEIASADGEIDMPMSDADLSPYPSDKSERAENSNNYEEPSLENNLIKDKSSVLLNDSQPNNYHSLGLEDSAAEIGIKDEPSQVQNISQKNDHMFQMSPLSDVVSESSEREIPLEPLSADESTPLTESRALSAETSENEPVREAVPGAGPSFSIEGAIGASEEREDISDDELDLYSSNSTDIHQEHQQAVPYVPSTSYPDSFQNVDHSFGAFETATNAPLFHIDSENVSYNDVDMRGSLSSDDREIIDLKLEDSAGKSEMGSQDYDFNPQAKTQSEDLEAVSDDELPDAAPHSDITTSTFNLIEGGEQVSSSEDEGDDTTFAVHQPEISLVEKSNVDLVHDASEFPYGTSISPDPLVMEPSSPPLVLESSNSLPLVPLEPISDEEDMGHVDTISPVNVEEREAGEIQSPVNIGSPVLEQAAARLLGEVEPISAEESSDTDGELISGEEEDDKSKPENGELNSSNNFLESIDSEEEGDLGIDLNHKNIPSNTRPSLSSSLMPTLKQSGSGYMETISDEEDNLCTSDNFAKKSAAHESSSKVLVESHSCCAPVNKDTDIDKRHMTANFNEHQEELDYEENEGDDDEGKHEGAVVGLQTKEDREAGEIVEDGAGDKDEGELSDDDCEEGEIKEPGSKKPFVKPMCKFFQWGNCTWGINCRFLHPGINDKGNYQMIEIPGFNPPGLRGRLGAPGIWPQQPEEPVELPPPPMPDVPTVESAWERGLRIAKEQRKKATERKELEPDFDDKCLNLSVDEERELNKENERMPKIIPTDPYYDKCDVEDYYRIPRNPWHIGRYENFEVPYNRSFSPPYRDKPPVMPPSLSRFSHAYSPPIDKFGRDMHDRREPFRPEPPPHIRHDLPPSVKRSDEWTDPWRRSKSPQNQKRKVRSRSRGKRRTRRSVSDSSNSSRSSSGSSSGSSRSSRSFNSSTGSSSRSRSPQPVPPSADRHDRYMSPSREPPRSTVTVRGHGDFTHDQGHRRGGRGYNQGRGAGGYGQRGGGRGGSNTGSFYNSYSGVGTMNAGGYPERDTREKARDDRPGRKRGRSPPDRPLPYVRPRPKSASSRSSSSRSRSRSHSRGSYSRSRSRSSSGSSRSSSSSSSSGGSADSEHLYRDLSSPSKNPRGQVTQKRKRTNSHRSQTAGKGPPLPNSQGPSHRRQAPPPQPPINLDLIPHPRDPKPPLPPAPGRPESKFSSRNAPPAPFKAKDPLKTVGQKSNIKLTLLPKQQQSSLGSRPNPLDSPPHKRRLAERDISPTGAPPAKRLSLPLPQASALRIATEKSAKLQMRQEKGKSPPPSPVPPLLPSSSTSSSSVSSIPRGKAAISPQKVPASGAKSRAPEPAVAKAVPKQPTASAPTATATGTKAKKSMSSRREELLKQLKAVEDAIARKKSKLQ